MKSDKLIQVLSVESASVGSVYYKFENEKNLKLERSEFNRLRTYLRSLVALWVMYSKCQVLTVSKKVNMSGSGPSILIPSLLLAMLKHMYKYDILLLF